MFNITRIGIHINAFIKTSLEKSVVLLVRNDTSVLINLDRIYIKSWVKNKNQWNLMVGTHISHVVNDVTALFINLVKRPGRRFRLN